MLAEADRTCRELQRAASRLEGHLAELERWSTEALDCLQHLKGKKHGGHSASEPMAKVSKPKLYAPSNLALFRFYDNVITNYAEAIFTSDLWALLTCRLQMVAACCIFGETGPRILIIMFVTDVFHSLVSLCLIFIVVFLLCFTMSTCKWFEYCNNPPG